MSVVLDQDQSLGALDALRGMHAQLDVLLHADLTGLDQDALLELAREQERLRRRLAAVDHALIAQFESRSTGYTLGCRDTTALLRQLLRLTPQEAKARVVAAAALGPRRTVIGLAVAPRYPLLAAAQADGTISAHHAQVITTILDRLPDPLADEHGPRLEAAFLAEAHDSDPAVLARRARYVTERLDPDGVLRDHDYRQRHRDLGMHTRPDGSACVSIEASAELAEYLDVVFDALAAPAPEVDGIKDPRTPGQRRHDALLEALRRASAAAQLPPAAGMPAILLITMTEHAYRTGTGLASTAHGRDIPAAEAIRWAGGDARVMTLALTGMREVSAYSHPRRLFSAHQRLAMTARDRGCTFPGCTAPPGHCEAHHVTDYTRTGRTSIDDGALVCSHDHRERIRQGWTTTMIEGRPHWVPPHWLDPTRRPRRNTHFDLPE
jgi:hypothetical protein